MVIVSLVFYNNKILNNNFSFLPKKLDLSLKFSNIFIICIKTERPMVCRNCLLLLLCRHFFLSFAWLTARTKLLLCQKTVNRRYIWYTLKLSEILFQNEQANDKRANDLSLQDCSTPFLR